MAKTKHPLQIAPKPHECLLLAIDPGKVCGAAVFASGKLLHHWSFKLRWEAMRGVLLTTRLESKKRRLPTVLVGEKWDPGGRMNPATAAGIGAAWGPWAVMASSHDYGIGLSGARIVRFAPREWRKAVLGKAGGHDTDAWKRIAQGWVLARYRLQVPPDAAEAICLGAYGCRAVAVGEALPGRMPAGWYQAEASA